MAHSISDIAIFEAEFQDHLGTQSWALTGMGKGALPPLEMLCSIFEH